MARDDYNTNPVNELTFNFGKKSSNVDVLDAINSTTPQDSFIERLRIAQVIDIDRSAKTMSILVFADQTTRIVPYFGMMSNSGNETGIWYGFSPGDVVICSIGPDNRYYILNKIGSGVSSLQKTGIDEDNMDEIFYSSPFQAKQRDIDTLPNGGFLIKSENDTKLRLYPEEAFIGRKGSSSFYIDTTSKNNAMGGSSTFETNQSYSFTYGGFSLEGIALRDTRQTDIDADSDPDINERLISQWYKNLSPVNFDNTLKAAEESGGTRRRNPSLIEKRQITYEFADYPYDNPIQSDLKESKKQDPNYQKISTDKTQSRRIRSGDVFSLSLVSPNYLIEEIKGTGIDVYGNILDINRTVLPIGEEDGSVTLKGTEESYMEVRSLHRRGLAYHWELNARKDPEDLDIEKGTGDDYALVEGIYKRNRSRMFFDIDKEGQFKINIPSSSETGNVPVLARYENYTTINPLEEGGVVDYDYFKREKDVKSDILLDAFGKGVVALSGNEKALPKDRTDGGIIKLGTAFHDISMTCVAPLPTENRQNPTGILSGPDTEIDDKGYKRDILNHTGGDSIVTKEIITSGENANAGGRSGTIVTDGMINMSIGANTVDRQSLWLDTAGGIVQRIGADLNGISLATQTDGDVYLQIGGQLLGPDNDGIDPDKRFDNEESALVDSPTKTNRFELRVMQGNGPTFTRILFDNEGIIICSPKNIEFRAEEDILFTNNGNISFNGEKCVFYGHTVDDDTVRLTRQSRKFEDVYVPDLGARLVGRGGERRTV